MEKIKFIGVQELKDKSVIQANVDEKILGIAILEFQELEIKRLLGRDEYARLSGELIKVARQTQPALIPSDLLLMEYIVPVMIYGSLMYSISPLHQKISNMGVKEDVNINSVSGDLATARATYSFKLDGYKEELILFLKSLRTDSVCCASFEDTTYGFTGMSLPDASIDREEEYRNRYYGTGGGRLI